MTAFHVAFITVIIYAQIATAFNDTDHQALKVQINDAKHAKEFSTLLNSIVNVNKERFDTMKKMTRLQQFPAYTPRDVLRVGESEDSTEDDDDDDADSGPEIVAYLVLPQQGPVDSEQSDNKDDSYGIAPFRPAKGKSNTPSLLEDEEDETLRSDYIENTLRSCHKRGYKKCKRACKDALREGCSVYKCHSRFKKKFKKECKRACKSFGGGDSGSDSDG